jgi:hypothetical protein
MIGSLDFSGMNFNFGSMDFGGLGNLALPPTGSLFTPEQSAELQQRVEMGAPFIPTTPPPGDTRTSAQSEMPKGPRAPVPNPLPPLPKPDDLSGTKRLVTNAGRYTVGEEEWSISAKPEIPKVSAVFGQRPANMVPQLRVNGIIVRVNLNGQDYHLISPQTLADIQKSGNPHYDVAENGRVWRTAMGKTVPVIEIDMKVMEELIAGQNTEIRNAGVRDVVFVSEGSESVDGIPRPLLDQINYTLDPKSSRPADTYSVHGLGLKGDYVLREFKVLPKETDGKHRKSKLQSYLDGIKRLQSGWTADLNTIKGMFYEGPIPPGLPYEEFTKVASITDPYRPAKTYTKTNSANVASTGTPSDKAAEKANEDKAKTEAPPLPAFVTNKAMAKAQWSRYGFTTVEGDSLLNPKPAGVKNVYIGDRTVNVNILWNPGVVEKARIVPDMPGSPPTAGSPTKYITDNLIKYYGTLPNTNSGDGLGDDEWALYMKANDVRMAELLLLARIIGEMRNTGEGRIVTDGKPPPVGSDGTGDRIQSDRPGPRG